MREAPWNAAAKLPPSNPLRKGGSCRYRTPRCLRHRHFQSRKERSPRGGWIAAAPASVIAARARGLLQLEVCAAKRNGRLIPLDLLGNRQAKTSKPGADRH